MAEVARPGESVVAAAVQMTAVVGDVAGNLRRAAALVDEAAGRGARLIVLPEFFTTGIAFDPRLDAAALPPDGPATRLLVEHARRHQALVGGSFLCRDPDGHVRNTFLLAGPDGVLGWHDKDLPTMWENAYYVRGNDEGRLAAGATAIGVALCWEFMRGGTARRLRERVDVIGGSGLVWRPRRAGDPLRVVPRVQASQRRGTRRCASSSRLARPPPPPEPAAGAPRPVPIDTRGARGDLPVRPQHPARTAALRRAGDVSALDGRGVRVVALQRSREPRGLPERRRSPMRSAEFLLLSVVIVAASWGPAGGPVWADQGADASLLRSVSDQATGGAPEAAEGAKPPVEEAPTAAPSGPDENRGDGGESDAAGDEPGRPRGVGGSGWGQSLGGRSRQPEGN
jgi:hypothetical protein